MLAWPAAAADAAVVVAPSWPYCGGYTVAASAGLHFQRHKTTFCQAHNTTNSTEYPPFLLQLRKGAVPRQGRSWRHRRSVLLSDFPSQVLGDDQHNWQVKKRGSVSRIFLSASFSVNRCAVRSMGVQEWSFKVLEFKCHRIWDQSRNVTCPDWLDCKCASYIHFLRQKPKVDRPIIEK